MDGVDFNNKEMLYDSWNSDFQRETVQGLEKCNLFGMTCDGRDIIANNFSVPDMEIGDWMVLGGMGAYTFGPKSCFNGMEATSRIEVWKGEMN